MIADGRICCQYPKTKKENDCAGGNGDAKGREKGQIVPINLKCWRSALRQVYESLKQTGKYDRVDQKKNKDLVGR